MVNPYDSPSRDEAPRQQRPARVVVAKLGLAIIAVIAIVGLPVMQRKIMESAVQLQKTVPPSVDFICGKPYWLVASALVIALPLAAPDKVWRKGDPLPIAFIALLLATMTWGGVLVVVLFRMFEAAIRSVENL